MREKPLSPRQQRFVEEYVANPNGTQAAIAAGYAPGSADVTAARLLANAKVAAAMATSMAARQERTQVDGDAALRWADRHYRDPRTPWRERVRLCALVVRYTCPLPERALRVEHSGTALHLELAALMESQRTPTVVTREAVERAAQDYARQNGKP